MDQELTFDQLLERITCAPCYKTRSERAKEDIQNCIRLLNEAKQLIRPLN